MELTEEKTDEWVVICVSGRLDTTNYNVLEKRMMELIDLGNDHILMECSKMDYISSSGLRILLMGLKKISQTKGQFLLCGLQENIREIFEISGFTSIFKIFSDQSEALKNF